VARPHQSVPPATKTNAWPATIMLIGIAGLGVSGCVSHHSSSPAPAGAASADVVGASGRAQLEERALRESTQPRKDLAEWPPAPGIEASVLALDDNAKSAFDLEQVRDALRDAGPQPFHPARIRGVSTEDKSSALKKYVRGRQKLATGRVSDGLRDLDEATKLDPSSADLANQAGLLMLQQGRRSGGVMQLRRALVLGGEDPRSLWYLGREESRAGRFEAGIAILLRAQDRVQDRAQERATIVLGFAISAELAEQLANAGYTKAAQSQLAVHLAIDPATLDPRDFEHEPLALDIAKRRAPLLLLAGDLSSRLGELDNALVLYTQAVQMGTVDATAGIARLITTQVRAGQPAKAAVTLLDDISRHGGQTTTWHAETARYLVAIEGMTPALPMAIASLCDALRDQATPALRRSLSLLAASVSDDSMARTLLLRELAHEPTSGDLLTAIIDRSASQRPEARVELLRKVVELDPMSCESVADEVLAGGQHVSQLVAVLRASAVPHDTLLLSSMLRRVGLADEAMARLTALLSGPQPATDLLRIATLVALGREDESRAVAASLPIDDSPLARRARATALDLSTGPGDAYGALTESDSDFLTTATIADVLFAADLAARDGKPTLAARALEAVVARDRFDERAFEGLVVLHMPGGPLPNEAQLGSAMQGLRRAAPNSRTIQWLLAQESVQRGLLAQAQSQLQSLISDRGEPEAALDLLVRIWEQSEDTTARQRGIEWLDARQVARPDSINWLLALTRLQVRESRAEEARFLLRARLSHFPIESLRIQEEYVVRTGLGRSEEADELAIMRLRDGPRTPSRSIALSEAYARRGNVSESLRALEPVLKDGVELDPALGRQVYALLDRLTPESDDRPIAELEVSLRVFEKVESSRIVLPLELLLRKVGLIAAVRADDPKAILRAIDEVGARESTAHGAAFARALRPLLNRKESSPLLRFLGTAALQPSPASEALASEWLVRTAAQGTPEDVTWMLGQLTNPEAAALVLRRVGARAMRDSLLEKQADVAYALGNYASQFGRYSLAQWCYRACLERDSSHAWAANNLGFFILEYGGDIAEARRLIVEAHVAMPDEPSIIDSYGWLKYKLGELNDDRDAQNRLVPGAASILLAAAGSPEGSENDEVLQHAGDALWRRNQGQDRAQAVLYWQRAAARVQDALTTLSEDNAPGDGLSGAQRREQIRVLRANQIRLNAKLDAAGHGQEPALPPIGIPSITQLDVDPPIFTPVPQPAPQPVAPLNTPAGQAAPR
jgi:tetratricopeptide (TPR) repeat protein